MSLFKRKQPYIADIALLLEGTYPFIRGGVSSWVHQMISGLPEYRFALVFLGAIPAITESSNTPCRIMSPIWSATT